MPADPWLSPERPAPPPRRVVDTRGIPRGHGESLDLGVQHLQSRQLLHRGVAARVLVLCEAHGGPVGPSYLDRNDLLDERPGVDCLDRSLMAAQRPGILLLPGDSVLHRAVVRHRYRHVEGRGVGGGRMRQWHPALVVPRIFARGEGFASAQQRCGGTGLHSAGQHHAAHSGGDLAGGHSDRGQAGCTLPVDRHTRNTGESEVDGDVACAVAAALQTLGEH